MRRANRPPTRRIPAVALPVVVAVCVASACSSSSQDGQNLARQACVHVQRSLRDYQRAVRSTAQADRARLLVAADQELRQALPLAAAANSDDGSWNSLMTTLSESAVVDEGHLVPALRAQCALAGANQNVNPRSPSTTTPRNKNPNPAAPAP